MERNFVITTNLLQGWGWLTRPGVVIIGAILVAPFVVGVVRWIKARPGSPRAAEEGGQRVALDVVLSATLLVVFLGALALAVRYAPSARLLPMVAAVPGAGLAAWQLARAFGGRSAVGDDGPPSAAEVRGGLLAFLALGGCFLLIRLVGFHAAAASFMLLFTLGPARMRPLPAVLFTAAVMIFVTGLGYLLGVRWPAGLLRL
jgi:hypothetical protein